MCFVKHSTKVRALSADLKQENVQLKIGAIVQINKVQIFYSNIPFLLIE